MLKVPHVQGVSSWCFLSMRVLGQILDDWLLYIRAALVQGC